jgi:hypothetical protein
MAGITQTIQLTRYFFIKKRVAVLFLSLSVFSLKAQKNADLIVNAGASYYMGDINPRKIFVSPQISGGLGIEHTFNPRYALRFGVNYFSLQASDNQSNNFFQQQRNASFSLKQIEFSNIAIFNFWPYKYNMKYKAMSPYVQGGFAFSHVLSTSGYKSPDYISFLFGLGFKVKLNYRWALGLEWSYRKTFTDKLDNLEDAISSNERSIIHNNDWYSFCGFVIYYKLRNSLIDCPAYD